LDLAGLDVGLVERIDPDDRARYGRGDLETEKLLPDVPCGRQRDARDRMTGRRECVKDGVVGRLILRAQRDEQTIVAVYVRRPERFARNRDQPLAVLAGRLRDELLGPRTEVGDRPRRQYRHLV